MEPEYKPNIYPIMYWATVYGIIAASVLLVLHILSEFIGVIWFPVFLAGVIWGGYRKYKQDKAAWMQSQGVVSPKKSPVEEFRAAAFDIAQASREMVARQAKEDATAAQAIPQETPVPPEEPIQDVDPRSSRG